MTSKTIEEQVRVIRRGAVDLIGEEELVERLKLCEQTGRPLRVKLGIDPSSPDIHIGHTVPLRKLRDFQRLGHQVVVVWGTSTAMVGDPSGKNKTRPQLTREQVEANMQTYKAQVGMVLDIAAAEERENSEWFDKMSFMDAVTLSASFTVAQILERDSFMNRYKEGLPISVHEFLYPMMQGWDSVKLEADVEIGGSDQLFNLIVGRELQKQHGQKPQICLTLPIIEGLDGVQKMSKSLGNCIGVTESPTDMFGKCMSIPDELMEKYFTHLTDVPETEIQGLLKLHPRESKVTLARHMVAEYHGADAAEAAVAEFDRVFQQGGLPDQVPEVTIPLDRLREGAILVANALQIAGICDSGSDGRRLVKGGGVKVDGDPVQDEQATLTSGSYLLQSGKRKAAQVTVP
ncbi:MAG: tyrosine--tRNA ligase [Planctomycetota bacterium]|nr:tyrosine--tRNA ligase [Planctomycetota bacterium]